MLTIVNQFSSGGSSVGIGYNTLRGEVLVYNRGANILRFDQDGAALGQFDQAGESANDYDLDVIDTPTRIRGVDVPAGTLLQINGESGTADIYASDPVTGQVLATLTAQFGTSHVVGGAYHAQRGTIFLVQDRVPSTNKSTVVEIRLTDGKVLNSFVTSANGFTINYGDMDVDPVTGDLFFVSSDENSVLRMSPEGEIIETILLPTTGGLSGIAFDQGAAGEAWVVNTSGTVFHLTGFANVNQTPGTNGDDTLNGSNAADNITGLRGDDLLEGKGGMDTLDGGVGSDLLNGGGGADELRGAGGLDTLSGGAGNDVLVGGGGKDVLTGGEGADRFAYDSVEDSPFKKAQRDSIEDFSHTDGDIIDLRGIDAVDGGEDDAFTLVDAFTGVAGQLIVKTVGEVFSVQGDTDGDGAADLVIFVTADGELDAGDFLV